MLYIATLLHEMAHIPTRSGHGRDWQEEMKRLKRLGAPIFMRDLSRGIKSKEIISEFSDAGWEAPWEIVLLTLGPKYGLTDAFGKPHNKNYARLITQAKKAHRRSWKVVHPEDPPAPERAAAALSRQSEVPGKARVPGLDPRGN